MRFKKLACLGLLVLLACSCGEPGRHRKLLVNKVERQQAYSDLLKQEGAKKEMQDSIFYGIYLKMPASEFYDHCGKMYRKGVFDGGYDMLVVVKLAEPFTRPVKLVISPFFDKPFISKLNCHFSYMHANIFNKADRANVLMAELLPVLMSWYGGNEFLQMPSTNPVKGPQYVKVDANRKIDVAESDNGTDIDVTYEDLKPLN